MVQASIGAMANVTLQVMPFKEGAHASMGTSFELLQFPEPGDTDLVYLEDRPVASICRRSPTSSGIRLSSTTCARQRSPRSGPRSSSIRRRAA